MKYFVDIDIIKTEVISVKKIGYVGTYNENGSKGIYRFDYENGQLSNPTLFSSVKNSKYIKHYKDMLISVGDFEHGSGVCLFDQNGKLIDQLVYEKNASCYVDVHNEHIYTTNYHEGSISEIALKNGKLRLVETMIIQHGGGCHQVLFDNNEIMVICLLLDQIKIFDQELEMTGSIRFPAGFGPRHGVFSKDGRWLYVIGELSNQLAAIELAQRGIVNIISVLENEQINQKDSAAIRISDDGKFVYVSTRGKNVISVIEVDQEKMILKQVVSTLGDHPRDFIIYDGHLIVANRKSNELISFKLINGLVDENKVSTIPLIEGVSIAMEE